MAVPIPYDAVAGTKLTAAALDAGLKAPLDFLLDGYPRVHAFDTSGASMVNTTATLVPFNSEQFDNDNMHNTGANTSRIVHTTEGLYDESWLLSIATATYTQLDLNIRMNAAGSAVGGSSLRTQPYSDGVRQTGIIYFQYLRFFAAGDYTEAFITQTSGANRVLSTTSLGTRCMSRWIASS